MVQGEFLDLKRNYSMVTKAYLKQGKDGYDCLVGCPVLIEEENIPMLYSMVENHFKTVNKLKENRSLEKFRCSIVPLVLVNRLINTLSDDPSILPVRENDSPVNSSANLQTMNFPSAALIITKLLSQKHKAALSRKDRIKIKQSDKYKKKIKEYEEESMKLEPRVEGRIVLIRDQQVIFIFFFCFLGYFSKFCIFVFS
jgi:hypothetical protein